MCINSRTVKQWMCSAAASQVPKIHVTASFSIAAFRHLRIRIDGSPMFAWVRAGTAISNQLAVKTDMQTLCMGNGHRDFDARILNMQCARVNFNCNSIFSIRTNRMSVLSLIHHSIEP